METKNAIITSASIEIEDHGILTSYIHLDYGNSGQAFGGYGLGDKKANYCGHFIRRVLDTLGASKWSEIKGTVVRVKADQTKVHEIGHAIKDDWFNPSEELKKLDPQ